MPLSPEDLKQMQETFATMLKEGLSADALTPILVPVITKAVDARLKGTLSAEDFEKYKADQAAAAAAAKAKEPAKDPTPGGSDGGVESTPAYKKAMAEIEELKKQTAAERVARQAAEAQRLQDHRNSLIRDALSKAGVDPRAQKAALNHVLAEGVVKITDAGKVVYQTPNAFGGVDEASVEDGMAAFLKTTEGRLFLPADPVRGSGGGNNGNGTRGPANSQTTVSPEDIALDALALL